MQVGEPEASAAGEHATVARGGWGFRGQKGRGALRRRLGCIGKRAMMWEALGLAAGANSRQALEAVDVKQLSLALALL